MSSYNTWKTRFDETGTLFPELKEVPMSQRVSVEVQIIRSLVESGTLEESNGAEEMVRLGEEYLWVKAGKPYYNIDPRLVGQLCRCDLGKLPASYFEVPGGFDGVLIRFCKASPELVVDGEEYVRSILMTRSVGDLFPNDLTELFENGRRPTSFSAKPTVITLRIDLGERGECEGLTYIRDWTISVRLLDNRTLDEEFASYESAAPGRIAPGTRRREVLENCLRLIATVGLIANSPEDNLLNYDVLSKDRQTFATASEERRQQLIDKARRRGKYGWNVGTNELFLGETQRITESHDSYGSGSQHSHAHIRTGHLHAVRCGPGRRDVKVKWFRPTVVRPDLPFLAV